MKYILLIVLILFPGFVLAQGLDNISYPIEELGNCQSREKCRDYCDVIANTESCFNFSMENNLPLPCDSSKITRFIEALKSGIDFLPCESKTECLDFCSKSENLGQCLAFGQKTGILSRQEALLLERTGGIGPGECKSQEECKQYCSREDNVDECLAFALKHGFMSQQEAAEAVRLRDVALKGGPGGCVGLKQCRDYCSDSDNFEECISFGKETGIITQEQEEEIKEFIKEGGPGSCKTQQECNEYCQSPENAVQCLEFMVKGGYLPKESIEAIEGKIEEMEESINQQMEEYKKNFNIDMDDEEIKKQVEEMLKPYKDILKQETSSVRSIASRIKKERGLNNILTSKTRIIARGVMSSFGKKESNLAEIFKSFFANIAQKILNK